MTSGDVVFNPQKVKNKVTEQEFFHIRQGMILSAGDDLRKARILYKTLYVFVILCFIVGLGQLVYGVRDPDGYKENKVPMIVSLLVVGIPNIVLSCYWKSYMKKSCVSIAKYFEKQNASVWTARGVQLQIMNTLIYVKILILKPQV